MKKSTALERRLALLCLSLIGVIVGLVIIIAAEHQQKVQYEQAACILSDVCHRALDFEDLDAISFEEIYYDTTQNLDCYNLEVDRDFVEHLCWAY